jgi:beta-N-acetylhexosaminidase
MRDKIGQLMIIGLRDKTLSQDESEFIVRNNIGGVILFPRNIESPEQLHRLCSSIQQLRHKTRDKLPLFISIDMEGGRVARLKEPFTKWPPLNRLGQIDSTSVSFKMALAMGEELSAVGINLDFAPCVDVLTNPANKVIGDRSISTEPEMVAKHSSALVRGYIKSGVMACAKHFPGHGNTLIDSHDDLPVEESDMERLKNTELVPFKKVFRARIDMVMMAHIRFPKIDPKWPATLSEIMIKDLLRKELRYRNLVITDDLDMGALAKNYDRAEIPVRAIEAGNDVLLYCNEFDRPEIALNSIEKALKDGRLTAKQIDEAYNRIAAVKKEAILKPDPLPWTQAVKQVGSEEHHRLAEGISSGQIPDDLLAG